MKLHNSAVIFFVTTKILWNQNLWTASTGSSITQIKYFDFPFLEKIIASELQKRKNSQNDDDDEDVLDIETKNDTIINVDNNTENDSDSSMSDDHTVSQNLQKIDIFFVKIQFFT